MSKHAERTFAADRAQLPEMQAFSEGFFEPLALHPKQLLHLQLALEEAVVNVCDYAYQAPPGEVTIRLFADDEKLAIELEDEGQPFDPLGASPPSLDDDVCARPVGGLGVYLINRLMDEVHYRREGTRNRLTMTMRRSAGG